MHKNKVEVRCRRDFQTKCDCHRLGACQSKPKQCGRQPRVAFGTSDTSLLTSISLSTSVDNAPAETKFSKRQTWIDFWMTGDFV